MAHVQLTADAREDLRDLDGAARKIVIKALAKLKDSPEQRGEPLGSRPGTTSLASFRKLIVGDRDYRVVYRVEPTGDVVVVWVIAKRADEECYQLARARVRLATDFPMAEELTDVLDVLFQKK